MTDDSSKKIQIPVEYELMASDNPGLLLTPYLLDGQNYLTWSRVMRTALSAKEKLGFIDGTVKKPKAGDPLARHWNRCNSMLIAWIFNSLEKHLQPSTTFAGDAKTLWDELKDKYVRGHELNIYRVQSKIGRLRQGGRSVQDYYTEMKQAWDELDCYEENLGCNCSAATKYLAKRDREKAHQFLMGLNAVFSAVRTNILSSGPLPPANQVFGLVSQDETQRTLEHGQETDGTALVVKTGGSRGGTNSGDGRKEPSGSTGGCRHCGMRNHTIDNCFHLHGFPDGWKEKKKGAGGRGKQMSSGPHGAAQIRQPTGPAGGVPGHTQQTRQLKYGIRGWGTHRVALYFRVSSLL
ncbi:hypothetical protein MLD38_037122 [Melastoma candidum]|uniref:Uncharacterized protein n=1 Tax=Melastoma candidum TaxID=119954 RepID=A0ACB9LN00_9MYRT|nr:hypothetical protein MLD38_037122 [Melastoma candidum]